MLENRIRGLVKINDMQLGFMPGKVTTQASFSLRRMQEELRGREKKLCMCFVVLEKTFERVPTDETEWALKKKRLPELLVQAVTSLYQGSTTKGSRKKISF